jgi:hypothetical protein
LLYAVTVSYFIPRILLSLLAWSQTIFFCSRDADFERP